MKAQELNPDQVGMGSLKVEPDAGGQEDWNTYSGAAGLVV